MSPLLPPTHYQHQQYSDYHTGGQSASSTSTSNDGLTTPSISTLSGGRLISSTVEDGDIKPYATLMEKKGIKRNKSGAQISSNSGGGGGTQEGEIKFDKDGNPKKKRKQVSLLACLMQRMKEKLIEIAFSFSFFRNFL